MAIQMEFKSKADELEAYFSRYPDVPKEVIIKSDLLHLGVGFTDSALKAGEGYLSKDYMLFSWDLEGGTRGGRRMSGIPEYLELIRGPYELRRTLARCRPSSQSPYLVDLVDGRLTLCGRKPEGYEPIAELLEYWPPPKYYSKAFEDGTPYSEVVPVMSGQADIISPETCQYWATGEQCLYCDMNENYRVRERGRGKRHGSPVKKVDQVAEVVREIFQVEEWPPEHRPLRCFINGGSIVGKMNRLDELDFYLRYVSALKPIVGGRWPLGLMTRPLTREEAQRCLEAGVNYHCPNLEVWDRDLFKVICPGKARTIGWDIYVKRIIEEVEVFGEGNVNPGLVTGVEIGVPQGFKDVSSAVRSTTEGIEFLMAHGVVPRLCNWAREPHSALKNSPPVPLDYYIQICRNYYELWKKYRLPEPRGLYPIGPGKAVYSNGAQLDMGDV